VAFAFADGLEVLVEGGGEIGEISVTGGGARSLYWGQLIAAALNRPLTYRQEEKSERPSERRAWREWP